MDLGPVPAPVPPRFDLPSARELAALLAAALSGTERVVSDEPGRRAAVLLPLYDVAGHPHVMLTKRADTLPVHRGQVSLPGGRWEEEDGTLTSTALRETHEEVGIPPSAVEVVGILDDVPTLVSGYIVTPVVGLLTERPVAVPNPAEIGRVLEVALGEILAIDATLPPGAGVMELRYPLDGEDVWGATARILHRFSAVTRAALEPS